MDRDDFDISALMPEEVDYEDVIEEVVNYIKSLGYRALEVRNPQYSTIQIMRNSSVRNLVATLVLVPMSSGEIEVFYVDKYTGKWERFETVETNYDLELLKTRIRAELI